MNALNDDLLEQVLAVDNLEAAWKAVKANRGAPGIDGIGIGETAAHLRRHWSGIRGKLLAGTYKPAPVRAVRIPKPGGGERGLGIPNTTDRLIQQAVHQKLSPVLEPVFSDRSYGYRPGRSAHDAIREARRYVVEEQRRWVIDIDIEGFFDNLDHDLLMRDLARHVSDKRVLSLIGKYLRAGVLEDGRVSRGAKGAPQGGPLSPLLANLYLDRLDREMESRGLAFVRYADDITVYAKSPRSAARIHARLVGWMEKHLKLRVNREKSGIRPRRRAASWASPSARTARSAFRRRASDATRRGCARSGTDATASRCGNGDGTGCATCAAGGSTTDSATCGGW